LVRVSVDAWPVRSIQSEIEGRRGKRKSERVVDEESVKAAYGKIGKPLFSVNVRLVASAGSQFQADDIWKVCDLF